MFHLTDRLLAKLIDGSATSSDLQRIRRHIDECRACARRLEEWRDNFTEVDERFPELSIEAGPLATVTPGGLVMLPGSEPTRRGTPDMTTILWIGAVLMALLVGYGASRLRQPSEGMRVATMDEARGVPRTPTPKPTTAPGPSSPTAPATPAGTSSVQTQGAAVPSATEGRPRNAASANPGAPAASNPVASPSPLTVSPRFREIGRAEAARRAGGPLRSIPGLKLDHIEVGPASAVPGAQHDIDVIRMVYRAADGSPVFLDQQRIPTDSDGLRSIDDPTLESGETAYGSSPNGVSVASWLDEEGYRLSIAARTPLDSLKKLVPLVQ